jgi:hypothetical protein
MSLSMRPLGHIDLFFALEIAEKRGCVIPTGALSEPEASRMGGVEGPRILPNSEAPPVRKTIRLASRNTGVSPLRRTKKLSCSGRNDTSLLGQKLDYPSEE